MPDAAASDRLALDTGTSTGIGAAIARQLPAPPEIPAAGVIALLEADGGERFAERRRG